MCVWGGGGVPDSLFGQRGSYWLLHIGVLRAGTTFWIYGTTFGYTELHLDILNYIWIYGTTFGHTELDLDRRNYVWIYGTTFGYTELH